MIARILIIMYGSIVIFILMMIVLRSVWFPALLRFMAEGNSPIARVEEGTAKAIKYFGQFQRFVMHWEGHYLDSNWNVIEGEPGGNNPPEAPSHWMDKILPGGLIWVGWIGKSVHQYHFQWTSIRQGKLGSGEPTTRGYESIVVQGELQDLLISRDEVLDYVFLKQDVYGITYQNTEDKDMIPLSAIELLTGQVVKPYKSLFHTEQWLEQVTNFLRPYTKEYIGKHTFIELVTAARENDALNESREILGYLAPDGTPISQYIENQWGFRIFHINLVNFKTGGARGDAYEEAAATEYVEAQRAKGIVKLAEAEKKRLQLLGQGEAERFAAVRDVAAQSGELGELILGLETLQEVGRAGNTVVIGNQPVQMLIDSARKPKLIQPSTTVSKKGE